MIHGRHFGFEGENPKQFQDKTQVVKAAVSKIVEEEQKAIKFYESIKIF